MEYTLVDWLLALAPLVAVLLLMVVRRWDAIPAGIVGWLLAVIIAVGRFGARAEVVGYAQLKAFVLTSDVVLIIWAALLLYYVVERAGALTVIAESLSGLTGDMVIQVLLLGWVFASFLQGVGGFGVPVAITGPLLVGLGVSQVRAAVIPSLGHGWAVTFGSLSASFIMLINVTGIPGERLATQSAIMLGVLGYVVGLMGAHALDGWRGVRRALPYVLVIGTVMGGAQYVLAISGLWAVAAIGAGLTGMVASVAWIRWTRKAGAAPRPADPAPAGHPRPSVWMAFMGYIILVILALGLRGIAPVKDYLDQWAVRIDIPASTTTRGWFVAAEPDAGFGIPGHAGLIILYSTAAAYWLYRRRKLYAPGAEHDIWNQAGRRAFKTGVGHFLMVAVAATLGRAGMMDVLANGLSDAVPGALYAFVAPVIGALGAFVTGSNVNSNAVFATLQRDTAQMLGLSVLTILAAQTSAAAVISVMSPAKVAVGCSTVGASEGVVMRWLVGYGIVIILLVGVMTWIGLAVL